jgi:hypothetical protein
LRHFLSCKYPRRRHLSKRPRAAREEKGLTRNARRDRIAPISPG